MEKPIALYLIGGFLGAGKTTFLKRYLDHFKGQKIGVLVNEFGLIGVDGPVLHRGGIEMVELSKGSIFCACLKQDFVKSLKAFSEMPIDALIIENSGMADPGGMQLILNQIKPFLERQYKYRGLICLVDCVTFPDYIEVLMPLQNQIISADFILINKTDLVSTEQVAEIHAIIKGYNPLAICYDTIHGEVPFAYLEENLSRRGMDALEITCS